MTSHRVNGQLEFRFESKSIWVHFDETITTCIDALELDETCLLNEVLDEIESPRQSSQVKADILDSVTLEFDYTVEEHHTESMPVSIMTPRGSRKKSQGHESHTESMQASLSESIMTPRGSRKKKQVKEDQTETMQASPGESITHFGYLV